MRNKDNSLKRSTNKLAEEEHRLQKGKSDEDDLESQRNNPLMKSAGYKKVNRRVIRRRKENEYKGINLLKKSAEYRGVKIEAIKEKILPIIKKYGIKRAGIFGSVVRGEETKGSDIDILVEIDRRMSLLEFAGLKIELEEALGRKVDLGEYSVIKLAIKKQILGEEVPIL